MPAADSRPQPVTLLALFLGALAVGAVVNGFTLLRAAGDGEHRALSELARVIASVAIASGVAAAVAATGLWRLAPYARWAVLAWACTIVGGYLGVEFVMGDRPYELGRILPVAAIMAVVLAGLVRYVWRVPARP